nr:NADH dehydrogenase subunit 2 [Reticulinasus faini]
MMFSNIIFLWFLMMSMIMALSSSSMFFLWICLEINIMSFIPLMNLKNSMSMNSIMIYFIIQSVSSSLYIFISSIFYLNMISINILTVFIMISMLTKLGSAPFHFWFPQISEGMSFNSLSILLTLQKIIPLYILSIFNNKMMMIPIILSLLIGSMGGFNQTTVKKILTFSSISHMSWMMSLLLISNNFWMTYLMIYSLIVFLLTSILNFFKINSLLTMYKKNNEINLLFIITLLTLGGMPPTIGFIMKWMSLKIISNQFFIISIPLIMSSLINLYFYLRLSYNSTMKNSYFYKWEKNYSNKLMSMIMFQSFMIFMMIPKI